MKKGEKKPNEKTERCAAGMNSDEIRELETMNQTTAAMIEAIKIIAEKSNTVEEVKNALERIRNASRESTK